MRYPSGAQSVVLNFWSPRTKNALLTFQSKQEILSWLKTKTFPAWLKELTLTALGKDAYDVSFF